MIPERQRGGARNDFDAPNLDHPADLSEIFQTSFSQWLQAAYAERVEYHNSVKVTHNSYIDHTAGFYPIDRKIPEDLVPEVARFLRNMGKLESQSGLGRFIKEVLDLHVDTMIGKCTDSGCTQLCLYPADTVQHVNTPALFVYVFVTQRDKDFYLETESSFRWATLEEPKIEPVK